MHACKARTHRFNRRRNRLKVVRRAGGSTAAYCCAAGISATFYGWYVCGVADTPYATSAPLLLKVQLATPDTQGRSVDLVFHTLDAASVCIELVAEARALPTVRCATACWG